MTEDINKLLENLKIKIEDLTKSIDKDKSMHEELINTLKILSSKIDRLEGEIMDRKIYHIKDHHILTYVIGAFAGGLIMGISLFKRAIE